MKAMLVLAVAAISSAAYAESLTLSVGDYHKTALGLQETYPGEFAGQYDWLDIHSFTSPSAVAISFNGAPVTVPLSTFTFTVGVNASVGGNAFNYDSLRGISATLDTVPTSSVDFVQPYSVLISSSDTLTLKDSKTFQIPVTSHRALFVTVHGLEPITSGIGAYDGQMTATVQYAAVPEATTMVLGLAATMPMLAARRRRRA